LTNEVFSYQDELLSYCNCQACPLARDGVPDHNLGPVLGDGPSDAKIAVVGEAPGRDEAQVGKPFIGRAGKLLDATLEQVGLRREDVFVTNVVLCRPHDAQGKDAAPPKEAIAACHHRLVREIADLHPQVVVAMGATAGQALCRTETIISKLDGTMYVNQELDNTLVIPTFHPAAILHGAYGYFDSILDALQRTEGLVTGRLPFPDPDAFNIPYTLAEDGPTAVWCLYKLKAGVHRGLCDIAIDLETDGFDVFGHRLLMVQMSNGEFTCAITAEALFYPEAKDVFIKGLLSPRVYWWMHNGKFDLQFLIRDFGIEPVNFRDTMCLALGLTEMQNQVGLKYLARKYLNAPPWEREIEAYITRPTDLWSVIPLDIMARYGCRDAYATIKLVPILHELVKREGTIDLCYKLLMPAQRCFAHMEMHGIKVDPDYVAELRAEWYPRIAEARKTMSDYAAERGFKASDVIQTKDDTLNPGSPKQLSYFLFEILRLRRVKGNSTDFEVLQYHKNNEFIKLLLEYRAWTHAMQTYCEGIVDDIKRDGRVHPDILLFGTVTGRLSIRNPPMQTLPRTDTTENRFSSIKKLFVASPGYVFVEGDYKQLELRIAYHYTGDELLAAALRSADFHTTVAAKVFGVDFDQVTSRQREESKFVTFGLAYGRGAWSLSEEHGWSMEYAEQFVKEFWRGMPQYYQWYKDTQKRAIKEGVIQTTTGRKRRWNLITPENRSDIERQAVNAPIQSLASDLCLNRMIVLDEALRRRDIGYCLCTVHDSIEAEIRETRLEEGLRVMNRIMTTPPWKTKAWFEVDFRIGRSWGETTKWKP
jgi:DNA polymerase-1